MPWIEPGGDGFRVCWREGGRGSPVQKGPVHKTKALASVALRAEREVQKARRSLRGGVVLSWSDLVSRWKVTRNDRARSERYIERSADILTALAEAKDWTSASSVTPGSIEGLKIHELRAIRGLLRYAQQLGQPVDHRAIAAAKPRSPRRQTDLLLDAQTVADLQRAADGWSAADGLLIHMIATYGHRAEELCRWTWKGVDLTAKPPTVTLQVKGGDVHRHPILPGTIARLMALAAAKAHAFDLVLVGHKGRPWDPDGEAARWITACAVGAKLGTIGVLRLRRYAISGMLSLETNGKRLDAKTVASITGHRTVSLLLNTYARTSEARQAEAIAAMGQAALLQIGATTVPPSKSHN